MSEQQKPQDAAEQNAASGAAPEASEELLGASEPTDNPAAKDPSEWVTGDEPITAAQRSYLDTLAREAGETIPADLTKAEAQLSAYRTALHRRLADATGELIARYREQPELCLTVLPDRPTPRRQSL